MNLISVIAVVLAIIFVIVALATKDGSQMTDFEPENSEEWKELKQIFVAEEEIPKPIKPGTYVASTQIVQAHIFTEQDVIMCAKVLYGECRNVSDKANQAAVIWCILNRVDECYGTIEEVITAQSQFCYHESFEILPELKELALDVLCRWEREHRGETSVGRVLPKNYLYFSGNGIINTFRDRYAYPFSVWDFSLENPYEN